MRLRRFAIILVYLSYVLVSSGQTQKGYVKTKGRMINGKHIPGQGLVGATVDIQGGNSYNVQNKDGSFFFPIPSQYFMVKSVLKKNYQLVDVDALKKSYQYSKNPLYLVMEKPEQQKQDLLDSERRIRRTLQQQLQQREKELEALKEEHKITLEEYQEALRQLYATQKNNEKFIADMAKEYAEMDYDQMTELNRRIHDAISNGRLTEADSLVRTKGDMKSRIEKVKYEEQVEKEREKEIEEEKRELEDVKVGTEKEKEDIAEDCVTLRKRFILELKVDSAAYYVEQLVNLDSTNVIYLGKAGSFFAEIGYYEKAENYYLRVLNTCNQLSNDNDYSIFAAQNNLANIYQVTGHLAEAGNLFEKNFELLKKHGGVIHDHLGKDGSIDITVVAMSLAGYCMQIKQYEKAESLFIKVIEMIRAGRLKYDAQKEQGWIATLLFFLGSVYFENNQYEKSDSAYTESIAIARDMAKNDSTFFNLLGGTLTTFAICHWQQKHYEKAESLCLDAIDAYRNYELFTKESEEFNIAQIWWQLALTCQHTQRPLESESWYKKALVIYQKYAQAIPKIYEKQLGMMIKGLAFLYKDENRLTESEYRFTESLDIFNRLNQENPGEYDSDVSDIQNEIGELKYLQGQYHKADSLFIKALSIREYLAEKDHESYDSKVIETLANLAHVYIDIGNNYDNDASIKEKWLIKALVPLQRIVEMKSDEYEFDLVIVMEQLAVLYWKSKRFHEAEEMYDRCLPIAKKFAKTNNKTQREYANLLYKLSQMYPSINNYNAAYKVNKEWLPILKQQFAEYPDLMRKDFAEGLGRQSFYAIFQAQYDEAEQLARDGLKLDSTLHWIASNLAPALLFQGKYKDAEKIYQHYKDELKDVFLNDFKQFAEAGVIPKKREKDVEKIKRLLNK